MLKLRVKEVAEEQGLNRNQLQLKSGVTLPLLTRYWNNATTEVKLDALERIAKALNVEPGELITTEQEDPQPRKQYIPDAREPSGWKEVEPAEDTQPRKAAGGENDG